MHIVSILFKNLAVITDETIFTINTIILKLKWIR